MDNGHRAGDDDDILRGLREALAGDADGIFAEGHGVDLEFSAGIAGNALGPFRRFAFEHDHGVLNGTMLRVVDDTADRAVVVGERCSS